MKKHILFFLFLIYAAVLSAQEKILVEDPRDGQSYEAIEFTIPLEGGVFVKRAWMTSNANYEVKDGGSYCYKDEPAYCDKFGRLYTKETAVKACPSGWTIPSRADWMLLFSIYGGTFKAGKALMEGGASGLNIFLGGFSYQGGYYNKVGLEGNYWDFDEGSANLEYPDGLITFNKDQVVVHFGKSEKKFLNSCRCIREH